MFSRRLKPTEVRESARLVPRNYSDEEAWANVELPDCIGGRVWVELGGFDSSFSPSVYQGR